MTVLENKLMFFLIEREIDTGDEEEEMPLTARQVFLSDDTLLVFHDEMKGNEETVNALIVHLIS